MLLLISRWAALAVLLTSTLLYKSSLRSLCFLTEMSRMVPGSADLSITSSSWLLKVTEVSSSSPDSGLENLVRVKDPAKQRWWPNLSILRYDPSGSPNWNVGSSGHFISRSLDSFYAAFQWFWNCCVASENVRTEWLNKAQRDKDLKCWNISSNVTH